MKDNTGSLDAVTTARRELEDAQEHLKEATAQALAAGLTKSEVAAAGKLSRATVDRWIDRKEARLNVRDAINAGLRVIAEKGDPGVRSEAVRRMTADGDPQMTVAVLTNGMETVNRYTLTESEKEVLARAGYAAITAKNAWVESGKQHWPETVPYA